LPVPGRNCYRADGDCDAQQLAAFDIAQWLQRLDDALPGARVRICRDALLWHAAENNFSWDCKDSASITAPIVIKIGWRGKNAEDEIPDQDDSAFAPRLALIVAPYVK
jgi:type IV pilus assembly protein PilV